MISYLWAGTGKCRVFIPYHSHQAIPIPILMKLAWRFPFPWEFYGTHGTHGNSQYILISRTLAYACSAWWGFTIAADRRRLDTFIRPNDYSRFVPRDLPTIADYGTLMRSYTNHICVLHRKPQSSINYVSAVIILNFILE